MARNRITKTIEKLISRKHHTIGIIGIKPKQVAKLNKEIVIAGSEYGFIKDQQHPNIFAVGLGARIQSYESDLIKQAKLCQDFGCDFIASTEKRNEKIEKYIQNLEIEPIFKQKTIKELARRVIETINSSTKEAIRPNLLEYDEKAATLEPALIKKIEQDRKEREERILQSQKENPDLYKFQQYIVGVLGGSGPAASAKFCEYLADSGISFIHASENWTPGRHPYEIGIGPTYIKHYKSVIEYFGSINTTKITIPCNTAHLRISEFCTKKIARKIADFREITIKEMSKNGNEAILLGTNSTVGVNANGDKIGIYQRYYEENIKNFPSGFILIKPSKEQQEQITKAIYLVKEGKMDQAKKIISDCVKNIRDYYQNQEIPVILACTELPLPFECDEMVEKKMIDPAKLVAQYIHGEINKKPKNPTKITIEKLEKDEKQKT